MEESWGMQEFMGSAVEDKREAKSLSLMADRLLANPELSFSSAVGENFRKSAWRIFSKQEVDVSYGHYRQTSKRCADQDVVLVSQDTTDLNYASHVATEGLGDLGGSHVNPGLCLHTAMALSEQGTALGLVGQKLWPPQSTGRTKQVQFYPLEEKESYRWVEALQWVDQHLAKAKKVIVISDRESDFYEYMAARRSKHVELLFRAHHLNRKVHYEQEKMLLKEVVFPNTTKVEVYLPRTSKRKERNAKLQVSWGKITCPVPTYKKGEDIDLWVVVAQETHTPAGEEPRSEPPLLWYLLTTINIEDQAAALLMIDYYRKRWVIERWHMVLKSGMQIEKLQFDTFTRLSHAIAMLCIVAWQLIWLKHLAAESAQLAAEKIFEPLQIEVLEKHSGRKELSVQQALIIIAALAGFTPTKKQPFPGEKTMWRGWAIFSQLCHGYLLASQINYETG
ncbi:hypothetical protein OKW21_004018 [Catalinimonas alkaloidigena]|nr:IS4 family transposase [Catalinimonas alkaloidigena]MDF9798755.1 hypothetical protein [Catalinimonas alkaloidigena]